MNLAFRLVLYFSQTLALMVAIVILAPDLTNLGVAIVFACLVWGLDSDYCQWLIDKYENRKE